MKMLINFYCFVFGFLAISSALDCRLKNISDNILKCESNGSNVEVQKLYNELAPDGTTCTIHVPPDGVTSVRCDQTVWKNTGTTDVSRHLSRPKRGFFDVLFCILTFFSCLWGQRSHPDRTPPYIKCIPSVYDLVNDELQTNVKFSWPSPTAHDNKDGSITPRRVNGRAPGKHFPEGRNVVSYLAKDKAGNRAYCDITINVKVIRCKTPDKIDNGYFQCFPSSEFIYGASCRYGCYEGFDLHGSSALTCLKSGIWSASQPRCQPWKCEPLPSISNSDLPKCTNRYYFRSICSYICSTGFDMPSRVSKALVCSKTKTWRQQGVPKCIDVEPPTFSSCPGTILKGTDTGSNTTHVSWNQPSVLDNSKNARALLRQGKQPGSEFTAGIHQVSYTAQDDAGNKALNYCSFKVVVRDIRCPRLFPTPYIHFDCPHGYRSGSRCNVSCDPGKTLIGSNEVGCDKSPKGLYGEWKWQEDNQSMCKDTRNCPPMSPPTNGAVACDNWEAGQFCQVQCRNDTEMSSVNLNKLYTCKISGEWSHSPPNGRTCRKKRHAKLAFGVVASFYFNGECTDETTQKQIANNFISTLQNSFYQPEVCPDNKSCNSANVQITCGQSTRKKRASENIINGTYVQLNIQLPIKTQTIENDRISTIYKNISELLQTSTDEIFGNASVTLLEISASGLKVQCPVGSVKSEQSLSCVDCTEGTFYYEQSGKAYCETCRKGTYQDTAGQSACIRCPYMTTTKTTGAKSIDTCEDACPPGSYSQDGTKPCSPCELGYYQPSYGQAHCRACKGSKSTLEVGSTSISNCEEFDIEFVPDELSKIMVNFRENISMTDFTLSFWLKMNVDDNSTAGFVNLTLTDVSNKHTWTWTDLMEISNENKQVSYTDFEWPDSQWHHILLHRTGCAYSVRIDGLKYEVKNLEDQMNCPTIVFNQLTITADRNSKDSISMVNIWDGERFKERYRHRCYSSEVGNLVSWKQMEEPELFGAYVHMPSQCDDFDNCASSPCLHGSCHDELHDYKCTCNKGYSGRQCDINEDDCIFNLCMNDATCQDGVSTYSCTCPPLYTGRFCEIEQVNGNWSEWGNWSECTTTCGNGTMQRRRLCNNPTPDNDGKDCIGESDDIQFCQNQTCPVCPELVPPIHGYLDCQNDTESINCTIQCDDGYDLDIDPLPMYYCGPETFHEWNFETDEYPYRRLPKCAEIKMAEKLGVVYTAYYRNLHCDTTNIQQRANFMIKETIRTIIKYLPCMKKKTCELKNLHVVNCHGEIRGRRSDSTAGFNLEISTRPANDGEDESLSDLEKSFQDIQKASDNGNLTIDVLGDEYVIDGSMTDISGKIECGAGSTRVKHYCVSCGRGSFLQGEFCVPCSTGTYQDKEGQEYCIPCPTGKSTPGIFSESVDDCSVDVLTKDDFDGLEVIGITVGYVSGFVVVIFVAFICRRYRSKIYKLVTPTDLTRETSTHVPGPSKPVLKKQLHVHCN